MWRVSHTCVFVTFSFLLFLMETNAQLFPDPEPPDSCRAHYNLSWLANETVASHKEQAPAGRRPLTILDILEATLNSSSREETATHLNISKRCLGYLEFSLTEVALLRLNTSDFSDVTFDDVFRGVFVSDVESALRLIQNINVTLQEHQQETNVTLYEIAKSNNQSLETETILDIMITFFNESDFLLSFDLLNRTTKELAAILAVDNADDLKNYSIIHFIKISVIGTEFISELKVTIQKVRYSLHVSWIEISQGELENVTSVLEVVLAKVPTRVRYLGSFIVGPAGQDLNLLNVTLSEIAELKNKSVDDLQTYKVYPELVSLIFETKVKIIEINRETKVEVGNAVKKILEAYNVTIIQLSEAFNMTEIQIRRLSPLKIELFSARFTLIRYVTNLDISLAEAAEKVNRTEGELSVNLTVKDFHVVIRKLVVVRTFEVMSQMLGVSKQFLVNSLNITVPVGSLSMCQLDGFLRTTRHTVLSLDEVITKKSLAFVVQINGFSITFVYKLTIQQFIIQVMRLNVREFFTLNGLTYPYSDKRLEILIKYNFFGLERLFQIHKDIPNYNYAIFRYSFAWIINRIIFLVETDVNECRLNTDRCHRLSVCINLPGTYQCRCPPTGYAGRYCEDINECEDGSAVCPVNALCRNNPGSYQCVCSPGFRHNATNNTCDDINECDNRFENNCFWGGLQCMNTVGSYECYCDDGLRYSPVYRRCLDINECTQDSGICSDIDANAVCTNTYKSYQCSCSRGYLSYYNSSESSSVLVNCTDIDECATGQQVCPRYSECVNTVGGAYCRCFPGYKLRRGKCRAKRFIPFLLQWIRYIFRRTSCERVSVTSGFPYFGKLHKKLYICPNGLISIGKKYYRKNPKRLKSLKKDVIAIFWTNTDYNSGSSLEYQVVDRSSSEFREQLDNVSNVIRNCSSGASDFNATWMLIVKWGRVSPYARFPRFFFFFFNPYLDEESTYQAVLVTNGTDSYAVYSYEDGGMEWTRRLGRKCAVGFATKNKEYSYEEEDSFGGNIFSIDTKEFEVNGVKRKGFFCKSLNAPSAPIILTNEQKCMNWYNEEPDPDSWMEELTDCPATRNAARRVNRYRRRSRSGSVECYELRFPTRINGASQQCCYYRRGRRRNAFVTETRLAGRAYRYHYTNGRRQKGDIDPFQVCCNEGESTLCSLFYEKRPLSTAASARPILLPCTCRFFAFGCRWRSCRPRPRPRRRFRRTRRAWFFGDPHVSTLDGQQYTFNGLGDYVLIRTEDNSLHLHGRTKRPLTPGGELTNATVFSGFALKTDTSDTAQILFDDSLPGNLFITVIKQADNSCTNHTIDFFNDGRDFVGMSIERSEANNKTVVVSFPSGFSIEVTPGIGLLQISISANEEMMNKTRGLMGNFNDDKTDDLRYPNGTVISANSTEEEIFHLGQQWKVPDGERLFVSSNCSLENVFFDEAFVPSFLNLSSVPDSIKQLCKGNTECIYDVLETNNTELGQQSAGFEEENQNIVNELANTPPEISGPEEVNVTLNEMTHFYITTSDPDNDPVTLDIEELPDGADFNSTTGHFQWTPVNATNITLEFIATDTKNTSTVLVVVVNMCQCQNNGECDFTEYIGDSSGAFRVVACNCTEQYNGTFCETEVLDLCADEPCADNVTCNVTRNPFGFQCGPCPQGLTGDGQNCFEIDECADQNVSRCNQTCVNTLDGFQCECRAGFTKREEGRICEDINECQEAGNMKHNCSENASCMNLPGSFNCSCNPGYEGDPYVNCTDINECENGDALCSQGCDDKPGSFACTCRSGFRLGDNNVTCEDVNECTQDHNCEHICDNLIGSYKCSCPAGLELNADNVTCKVSEGSACDNTNGGCQQVCVNRTGLVTCYCNSGYNLTNDGKTCIDINECMTGSHGCSQKCSNNDGSYTCGCHPGYQLGADNRTCNDINECMTGSHGCSQKCSNNDGSYTCGCHPGYQLGADNRTCNDINECMTGSHGCSQKCSNNDGSYTCGCHPGYQLGADNRTCNDVNECNTTGLNNCTQICKNSEGSFHCSCGDGFTLHSDNTSCTDIDECNSSPPAVCSAGSCVNVPGSYRCQCPQPLIYDDGRCRGKRVFTMSMTLALLNGEPVIWDVAYLDATSSRFGYLARRVEMQVNWWARRTSRFLNKFLRCLVRRFRRGSVVADVDLVFADHASDVTEGVVNNELPSSGQMGNLTYDPSTARISDPDECAEGTHNCHANANCNNKAGSFDCKCKDGYQGDGVTRCDVKPEEADDDDDDRKKRLAIILGCVFGGLLLIIIIGIFCSCRNKRYKANMEDPNRSVQLSSRSVRSDVYYPPGQDDKEKTGFYSFNADPEYENAKERRITQTSGDYDFPDPAPEGGQRTTHLHYDNPGLQKDSAL